MVPNRPHLLAQVQDLATWLQRETPAAVPALIGGLSGAGPVTRAAGIRALTGIGERSAAPLMV